MFKPIFGCAALTALMVLVLASVTLGQEPDKAGPELKAKFYQDFLCGDPNNPNLRPVRDANFRWEAGGARVTMPAGAGVQPTAGVAANFKIKGDFEITASYEVLKAEKPTEGYGVGVSLFVAIDPDALDAVSLARRVGIKGGIYFFSDRMKGNDDHKMATRPSKAPVGKLRVKRVGAMVRFYVAEGKAPNSCPSSRTARPRRSTGYSIRPTSATSRSAPTRVLPRRRWTFACSISPSTRRSCPASSLPSSPRRKLPRGY